MNNIKGRTKEGKFAQGDDFPELVGEERRKYKRLLYSREYRKRTNYRNPHSSNRSNRVKKSQLRLWVHKIKNRPCQDCNGFFPPCAMDFDHRDAAIKISSISALIGRGSSIQKIQEEILKCDLVCSNCHRVRTNTRRLLLNKSESV